MAKHHISTHRGQSTGTNVYTASGSTNNGSQSLRDFMCLTGAVETN
ncbi:hypothetical protein [Aeoliella mucimassa]|nr:hypothetical protein [Aeoliella mucimassa]